MFRNVLYYYIDRSTARTEVCAELRGLGSGEVVS